jgi:hypothetical protein
LRFLLPVPGSGGNAALFMDYILQFWGQENIFIHNSWGTEVFATVEDSVLRNSWGTELFATVEDSVLLNSWGKEFGCVAGAFLVLVKKVLHDKKVCNKVFI